MWGEDQRALLSQVMCEHATSTPTDLVVGIDKPRPSA
jgi:hypothetical protein